MTDKTVPIANAGHTRPQWAPDACQQLVIDAGEGCHLVLAPPGCGKTQILTQRISKAHAHGVGFADMLCLTFTNRAARGMAERIREYIDDEHLDQLYVGNIHRFCSRFLFTNGLVAAESSVVDDDDAVSILARYLDEDEYYVAADHRRRREYAIAFQLASFMHQIRHNHLRQLRMHPECLNSDDIAAMRSICRIQGMAFDAQAMLDIYDHTDDYRDAARSDAYDYGTQHIVANLLRKMTSAKAYEVYKRRNNLLDFEDLLMLTYDALAADTEGKYKRYAWVQVDEVQDLNALQMAIVDLLTSAHARSVVFLGDEQQAIFSFMGAKLDTLDALKKRCRGHLHHLNVNHRSPKYLLDVLNCFASEVLGIDKELLPTTDNVPPRTGDELKIVYSDTMESEVSDVANVAHSLYQGSQTETTAILVNSNRDAELVSQELRRLQLPHFKVSGTDLFSTPDMKFLLAHLNLLGNDTNFIAWARVFKGLGVFETNASCRKFMRNLLDRAITPSDVLTHDIGGTYLQDFIATCDTHEIVVFDTETTGLSVFDDEIAQIAAVKMRGGRMVEGSEFSVFIATDKPLPPMLGDIANPLIEEIKHHTLLSHRDALKKFMDYVGDDILVGHNADYDYHILDNNMRRYLDSIDLRHRCPKYFDTLRLARLLEPGLKEYKLKHLLAVLQLEGSNSHLADEDVYATHSLVKHCLDKARTMVAEQRRFLMDKRVEERMQKFRARYADTYRAATERMYVRKPMDSSPALVDELLLFQRTMVEAEIMQPVEGMGHVVNFLTGDVIATDKANSLAEQLARYMVDINTFKEADLCNSRCIDERVYVTTVHKAKGLEFDNVIIFDAIDGRWPNYFSKDNPKLMAEDARKFYVAMSRAKRRLYVAHSTMRVDYHNDVHPQYLTRFMRPLLAFFN